jgi:hypothetical protein
MSAGASCAGGFLFGGFLLFADFYLFIKGVNTLATPFN